MPGQNKSGGGSKKIGRNKAWCENYKRQGRREKSKLASYKLHNIPKQAEEKVRLKMVSDFINMQNERRKGAN